MFPYLFLNYCQKVILQVGIIMWYHWVQSSQTCPISLESQLISLQMQCRAIKLVINFVRFLTQLALLQRLGSQHISRHSPIHICSLTSYWIQTIMNSNILHSKLLLPGSPIYMATMDWVSLPIFFLPPLKVAKILVVFWTIYSPLSLRTHHFF